ncbi:hypothetical protein LJR027_003404 [Terrabacter sp. LjRoot27]|uniref:hypothetical protein n=1 Tax=Terrabacter sp. LjRoot27 TaxID=3342306 RepID=UPI003ECDB740
MKKMLISLACAGVAAAGLAVATPTSASAGDCVVVQGGNSVTVHCYPSAPGTQYRIVVACPDGLRWSRWEDQAPWYVDKSITMQCTNIRLHDIQYR